MNITYQTDHGILTIEPEGALQEDEFKELANEIKKIKEDGRDLKGVLIHTKDFPGYEKFSDALAHGDFIKEHRNQIEKVALCTDSMAGKILEGIGKALTGAEVKKFGYDQKGEAEKWIAG